MFNESHFQKKKLKKTIYLFRLFIEPEALKSLYRSPGY